MKKSNIIACAALCITVVGGIVANVIRNKGKQELDNEVESEEVNEHSR